VLEASEEPEVPPELEEPKAVLKGCDRELLGDPPTTEALCFVEMPSIDPEAAL
jgi:hypothetical protein